MIIYSREDLISNDDPNEIFGSEKKMKKVGSGEFGLVYSVQDLSNQKLALKIMEIDKEKRFKRIEEEVSCLGKCSHTNIVKIEKLYYKNNQIWVNHLFDKVNNGTYGFRFEYFN